MPWAASSTTSSTCPTQSPSRARSSVTTTPAFTSRSLPRKPATKASSPSSAPPTSMRAGFPAAGHSSSPAANSRSKCSTSAMTPPDTSTRRLSTSRRSAAASSSTTSAARSSARSNLLNRWIVPLEGRVDYLNLHTGKSFVIPFEELVIFSTNLEPEDLMDPAFLRRLPYKIEIGAPPSTIISASFKKSAQGRESSSPTTSFTAIALQGQK